MILTMLAVLTVILLMIYTVVKLTVPDLYRNDLYRNDSGQPYRARQMVFTII